jgi:hypothetical protein
MITWTKNTLFFSLVIGDWSLVVIRWSFNCHFASGWTLGIWNLLLPTQRVILSGSCWIRICQQVNARYSLKLKTATATEHLILDTCSLQLEAYSSFLILNETKLCSVNKLF